MVQDPDAAGPRSGVRIRDPVPPGAPAGGGDAGRRSDCTVHSAVVSASTCAGDGTALRRCRPQPPRRPHLPLPPAAPAGPPGTPPPNRGGFPPRQPRRLARRRRFRPRSPGPPGTLRRPAPGGSGAPARHRRAAAIAPGAARTGCNTRARCAAVMAAEPGLPGEDGGAAHPDPRQPPGTGPPARQAPTGSAQSPRRGPHHRIRRRFHIPDVDSLAHKLSRESLRWRAASRQGPGRRDRTFSQCHSGNPAQESGRLQSRQSSPGARRSAGTALTQPSPACLAHTRSPGRAPLASYRHGSSSLARCRGGPGSRRRVLVVLGYLRQPG